MPEQQRIALETFLGLQADAHNTKIEDNKASDILNMLVTPQKALTPWPGYVSDGSPFATSVRFMLNFLTSAGTEKLLLSDGIDWKFTKGDGVYTYFGYTTGTVTRSGTALTGVGTLWNSNIVAGDQFKYDADSTWLNIATVTNDTSITLSTDAGATSGAYTIRKIMNGNNIQTGCILGDVAVLSDNTRISDYYDGTSLRDITNMPVVNYLTVHKRHIFGATGSTIYWSDLNAPTTWTTTNLETIANKDGGNIIGIKSFANSLVIVKSNGKVYQLVGEAPFIATTATYSIIKADNPEGWGNIAERAFVIHDNLMIFVTSTGVYGFDGVNFTRLSDEINTTTDTIYVPRATGSSPSTSTDDSEAEFDAGTHSDTDFDTDDSMLKLDQDKIFDQFTDGDFTSNPTWTSQAGSWSAATNKLVSSTGASRITVISTNAYGRWEAKITVNSTGANFTKQIWGFIASNALGTYNGYSIETRSNGPLILSRMTGGSLAAYLGVVYGVISNNVEHTIVVTRTSAGVFEVFLDGVSKLTATDTTYTTSANMDCQSTIVDGSVSYDDFKTSAISGNFISQVFDGTTALNVWTILQYTGAANGESITLSYRAEAVNPPVGAFTTVANGANLQATSRYLQYKITFASSTKVGITPTISAVSISKLTSSAQLNTPHAWANNKRLNISYGIAGASPSRILRLDEKDQWVLSDIPVFTTGFIGTTYYGSSPTAANIWILDSGLTANGSAMTRYYITKNFDFGYPEIDKTFDRMIAIFKFTTSSISFDYAIDDGSWQTATISLDSAGSGDIPLRTVTINQAGKKIKFRFYTTNVGEDLELHKLIMYMNAPLELRVG